MQRKLIVVVVGFKKWNRTFGLEPIPSVKTGLPFKTFQYFRKFLTGTSGARGPGTVGQSTLKSTKSLFESIVCDLSVLNHLSWSKGKTPK